MIAIMNLIGKDGGKPQVGLLDGKIVQYETVRKEITKHLKAGTAKKLIDTEETLMYRLGSEAAPKIKPE